MTHTLEQNKGAHIESGTGTDIPTGGDKSSTGCEDSLSLSQEVSQAEGLLLSGHAQVERWHAFHSRWDHGRMVGWAAWSGFELGFFWHQSP